jgi:hypothetical protein
LQKKYHKKAIDSFDSQHGAAEIIANPKPLGCNQVEKEGS